MSETKRTPEGVVKMIRNNLFVTNTKGNEPRRVEYPLIADTHDEWAAIADAIERVCTERDELAKALRAIRIQPAPEASMRGPKFHCLSCNHEWPMGGEPHHAYNCVSEIARAALAKVQGHE